MTNMLSSYLEGRDTIFMSLMEVKQLPQNPKINWQYGQNRVQFIHLSGIIDNLLAMFWTLHEALE